MPSFSDDPHSSPGTNLEPFIPAERTIDGHDPGKHPMQDFKACVDDHQRVMFHASDIHAHPRQWLEVNETAVIALEDAR